MTAKQQPKGFAQGLAQQFQQFAARVRPGLERAARWSQGQWRRLRAWVPGHRRAATASGIGAAVVLTMMIAGVPGGSPERQVARQALVGKELYASLAEQHPGVARASRVDETAERGSRLNLVVLPDGVWTDLSTAQRNSIGSWLNSLGGRWEIRVGKDSTDHARVLEAEAVITSQQWNQQLK